MKSFNLGNKKWIALAVAIAGINSAQALTLSVTKSWGLSDYISSTANVTSPVTDYFDAASQVTFDQFDTSLGTLNSVSISYTPVSIRTDGYANFRDDDWANETAGTQSIYGSVYGSIAGLGYSLSRTSSNRTLNCAGSVSLTSGSSCGVNFSTYTQSLAGQNYSNLTSASVLNAFTGSGVVAAVFDLGGRLYTNETDGDDGYITSRYGYAYAFGNMTISYDYTAPAPVPVPAAAWLFGSAIVGLATVGRRRAVLHT